MKQVDFADKAKKVLAEDSDILGLAVGGSWLSGQIDEFSDLDLILVTAEKITDDKSKMLRYAKRLGNFLSGFTGEHVGEPRLLVCLFDDPLLHVDLKFVTLDEFYDRIETPEILFDRNGKLKEVLDNSVSVFPYPDHQWLEDRFWTWIHYALLKIGRGEYFEAVDFFAFLRATVLGPLIHIKNRKLPRRVRRVEAELDPADVESLRLTIPRYDRESLLASLRNSVALYRELRSRLFDSSVSLRRETEKRVMSYFDEIESRKEI